MAVRIEKKGRVWTVIHSRPEARNAMNPESADALVSAFEDFDKDPKAKVAVLWGEGGAFCAGWDLKYCASLIKDPGELHSIDYPLEDRKAIPRGPLGPTRLELDKPVIAAVAGPAVAGGFELARPPGAPAVGPAPFCRDLGRPFLAIVIQQPGEQHRLVGNLHRQLAQPVQADVRVGRDKIEVPVNGDGHGGEDREEGRGVDGDSFAPRGA